MTAEQNRKIQWAISLLLVTLYFYGMPAQAQYGGGTGEPNNPYLIYTAEQMNLIGVNPEDRDKHFRLMADIDLSGITYSTAVIPGFNGVFDGNSHTISHLTITGMNWLGLFGYLASGAEVKNIGVVDVKMSGLVNSIGGLVGINFGNVIHCYSVAWVSGENEVGGLVGSNGGGGLVSRCYSTGMVCGDGVVGGLVGGNYGGSVLNCYSNSHVHGKESVGGLVGSNSSNVSNCYSTGVANGDEDVGGLVGSGDPNRVTGSWWDTETSGQVTSAGGKGQTTAEMQTAGTFLEAGWDFVDEIENGTEDIWWILEGQDYPVLRELTGGHRLGPVPAFCPEPQDGTSEITQSTILSWVPGGVGLQYDVYFGEDKQAVINATIESQGIYCGRLLPEMTTYEPGYLGWSKTYYWRIDGVNEAEPNNLCKGSVWSFTTANFIVIDDFESYNDLYPDDPDSNPIWNTWIGGYDDPTNGSIVGCDIPPWIELTIAHRGRESMSFLYDNSGSANYSEATMTLTYPRDWTEEGISVLSLWFGDMWPWSSNTPESMYVALANANGPPAIVYHDNPDATTIKTWTEWIIYLQEFADQGMNLANVDTISIGFGDKNGPYSGGSGYVYFDDIRLYRPP